MNQYGEETVKIKGVYATDVGADTPTITRLINWKIVPKRAVELAVVPRDANASPWSSVNNCTGSESEPPILDLTKPLNRREKRELLSRIRKRKPTRKRLIIGTPLQNAAIEKTIEEIFLLTEIRISRIEALHMMVDGNSLYNGKWLRGPAKGEIFSAAPSREARARKILIRVAALSRFQLKDNN